MQFFAKLRYQTMYFTWAGMFALTAVLGFCFPAAAEPALRLCLQLTAAAFFIPPWLILAKAQAEQNVRHIRIVRYLSLSSIAATCVLLVLNIRSVGMSPAVGVALNTALTVVSAPLVCSNLYWLPLFLWGTLLMGSFRRR